MIRINGARELMAQFQAKLGEVTRTGFSRVAVGYSAPYAIYVHENLQAYHPIGQAKFLEEPARRLASAMGDKIVESLRRGLTVEQALQAAGSLLLQESRSLVPVDTGRLYRSGFIEVNKDNK